MSIRYKVKTTAYTYANGVQTPLGCVHRIVGSLVTAELARKRNIVTITERFPNANLILTRKEVWE